MRNISGKNSLELKEEKPLAKEGHTIHYDGFHDQGRAPGATKNLVRKELVPLMGALLAKEREEGLAEVRGILKGIMKGKQAIVKLSCEGPTHSPFSIACAQMTDSFYVCHSEELLYRRGYEHFRRMASKDKFFRFVHSAGRLDENGNCLDLDKRRIYQDMEDYIVFSTNNQYAGNSVGLKKHAMRLAIKLSGTEGWLCEHMFVMSVQNEKKARSTYFCGAFPSACGKTATAMLPGEKIIGDDIAYFRNIDGEFRAVNVENGIFGIIKDVNALDDPLIFKTLQTPGLEIIFSNVLTGPDNEPYWLGMGVDHPMRGWNFSGEWFEGKTDQQDNPIPFAHSNARYTLRLGYLENIDPAYQRQERSAGQGHNLWGQGQRHFGPHRRSCGLEERNYPQSMYAGIRDNLGHYRRRGCARTSANGEPGFHQLPDRRLYQQQYSICRGH